MRDLLLLGVEAGDDLPTGLVTLRGVPVGVGLGLVGRSGTAGVLQLLRLGDEARVFLVDVLEGAVAHDVLRDQGLPLHPVVDLGLEDRHVDRDRGDGRDHDEERSADAEDDAVALAAGVRDHEAPVEERCGQAEDHAEHDREDETTEAPLPRLRPGPALHVEEAREGQAEDGQLQPDLAVHERLTVDPQGPQRGPEGREPLGETLQLSHFPYPSFDAASRVGTSRAGGLPPCAKN